MRWQVTTEKKIHIIPATSSSQAVSKVQGLDKSKILSVKLMSKNTLDKVKSKWRSWFGK